jgi:hypothetical protein
MPTRGAGTPTRGAGNADPKRWEVIAASRPWRGRLKAYGAQAFVFEPAIADQFADVNTSGTLDEEKADLAMLTGLVEQHKTRLMAVGMKPDLVIQGKVLLDEANGHGLLGILGIRSQEEAIGLRNRILTYATLLAREARAAGINGCFDDAPTMEKFEAASFRNALRRIQPRRRGAGDGGGDAVPVDGAGGEAKPAGGEVSGG